MSAGAPRKMKTWASRGKSLVWESNCILHRVDLHDAFAYHRKHVPGKKDFACSREEGGCGRVLVMNQQPRSIHSEMQRSERGLNERVEYTTCSETMSQDECPGQ